MPSNNLDNDTPSLHSDFSQDFKSDPLKQQKKQPLLSFNYHSGFLCFFEDYVQQQGWTFHECYQNVFKSHHEITKIKRPVEDIAQDKTIAMQQKREELKNRADKDKVFVFHRKQFNRKTHQEEQKVEIIQNEDLKIKEIDRLKAQLNKLNDIKDKVIQAKKKDFQLKEIQRSKELEKEIEGIMGEKQRRVTLIRKVQEEAEQRRQQRESRSTINGTGSGMSNCEIM